MRWCHASCSDLDPQVIKYFDTQFATTGTHSWSCTGCNVAYTAMNKRIRQLENKQIELEKALKTNQEETTRNTGRLDGVEKEMADMKNAAKKDKEDIVKKTTSEWSREMMERESRKGNMVIYGLPEPPADVTAGPERQRRDKTTVGNLFQAMKVDVKNDNVKFAARVGKVTESVNTNPRPLRMSFRDHSIREKVFSGARNLPDTNFHAVSIVPDLTDMQRREDKELFKEAERLNEEMDADQSENYFYRCVGRRGERTIVKLRRTDRNSNRNRNSNMNPLGNRNSGNNRTSDNNRDRRVTVNNLINMAMEDTEPETLDSNNKRGRQEESDELLQESPTSSQARHTAKRSNKNQTRNT